LPVPLRIFVTNGTTVCFVLYIHCGYFLMPGFVCGIEPVEQCILCSLGLLEGSISCTYSHIVCVIMVD
jgi:hypothetical protein